jgi:Ca2+-binding RTX toxin-like protein
MERSQTETGTDGFRMATEAVAAVLVVAATILATGAASGATQSEGRPFVGTAGADEIVGTRHADTIHGRGGADRIAARARGDRVFGGAGFDTLRGGRGADRLVGQRDGALLVGGSGRDEFNMRAGVRIAAGGRDVIRARDGRPDEINCGSGDDVAYVDRVEDGVYDCERVVMPDGVEVDR